MAPLTLALADPAPETLLGHGAAGDSRSAEDEAADRAGRELVTTVSHDLKNPLAVIKGRAQLLRRELARPRTPDVERLDDGLAQIERTASEMVAMLDELMDVSYTQTAVPTPPDRRPTDLVALARRVATEYQQLTKRHRIRVRATEAAVVGNWDAARLERVVVNLLSNAIKYSPAGGDIDLTVACDKTAGPPWAVLRVGDHNLMLVVGVVEIVAGLVVWFRPRFGGYLVAAWLGGIILNLLTLPGYFDVALRDFGLALGALALARLATAFERR